MKETAEGKLQKLYAAGGRLKTEYMIELAESLGFELW